MPVAVSVPHETLFFAAAGGHCAIPHSHSREPSLGIERVSNTNKPSVVPAVAVSDCFYAACARGQESRSNITGNQTRSSIEGVPFANAAQVNLHAAHREANRTVIIIENQLVASHDGPGIRELMRFGYSAFPRKESPAAAEGARCHIKRAFCLAVKPPAQQKQIEERLLDSDWTRRCIAVDV
jgi:hypothetical protein